MSQEKVKSNRRKFLKDTTVTTAGIAFGMNTLGASVIRPVLGANDRIRMGFIGVGNRGWKLLRSFMSHEDVEVVALCDVYEPILQRDRSKVDPRLLQELGEKIPPR